MNFFDMVWDCLNEGNISSKVVKFRALEANLGSADFSSLKEPKKIEKPSYSGFCKVYSLEDFPRQKTPNKNSAFLHAVAHIEYSAIDIALDACYRFRSLPYEFYSDWLEVANDEIRHFEMVNAKLEETGMKYGDLAVHNGLFVALNRTAGSLLDRMAVLPRHMEAGGLDANTNILSKLSKDSDLVPILELIRDEEVSHVSKGDKWFRYACEMEGKDPSCWLEIVQSYYPKAFANPKPIDKENRKKAGFSDEELSAIEQISANAKA